MDIVETCNLIELVFLRPFFDYLQTGKNTLTPRDFLKVNDAIVNECDSNDNSNSLYVYAKSLIRSFCSEKLLLALKGLPDEDFLSKYALWQKHH